MKKRLKRIDLFRNNYRRVRKIILHIRYGRFYKAFKLANHYNPLYWIIVGNPYYVRKKQRKNLIKVLARNYPNLLTQKANKKFRLALVLRNADTSPTSSAFIRLVSPLTHKSIAKHVRLTLMPANNIKAGPEINIYIVQRTAFNNLRSAKKFVSNIRANNSKLIVDNDDAFALISETHPEYKAQLRRIKAMEYLLYEADQIWLSVDELIESKFADKSFVVANTLDKNIWSTKKSKPRKLSKRLQMVYMGTATHDADFQMILPALDAVYAKFPRSFFLTTIGVSQDLPDRDWIGQLNTPRFGSMYPTFVQWFKRQGPFDIGLSPLVDNEFNRSKSDIKCLDYIAAGVLSVVSDIKPYQTPELADYIIRVGNSQKEWTARLGQIVSSPEQFRAKKAKTIPLAQKYLWKHRSSETTANKLLNLLERL